MCRGAALPRGVPSSRGTSGLRRRWRLGENFPLPLPARIYINNRKAELQKAEEILFKDYKRALQEGRRVFVVSREADLNDESGGSLFITVRRRVRRPFFPSHTRLLSVLTSASTSGMLAFMEMALSSLSSWLFSSRYLFLEETRHKTSSTTDTRLVRRSRIRWTSGHLLVVVTEALK